MIYKTHEAKDSLLYVPIVLLFVIPSSFLMLQNSFFYHFLFCLENFI